MVVIALRLFNYNLKHSHQVLLLQWETRLKLIQEVIKMKEDNWNINTNKVQLWLEQEDRGDNGKAIELSIMLGNNCQDDELRSTYWTAIRSIGSSFDDFPMARRGRESALPDAIELAATSVKNTVIAAFADITDSETVLKVILPHGRTGGSYATIGDLAEEYGNKAYRALVQGYKDGRWDGTMEDSVPQMASPAVKADLEAEKEV
tara:strand:- start:1425 stop:2039 length:615 start_codon:yes stop_codon:yes gene_type:complete